MEPAENMQSGKVAAILLVDIEPVMRIADAVPHNPSRKVNKIVTAPLNAFTFTPDIIAIDLWKHVFG